MLSQQQHVLLFIDMTWLRFVEDANDAVSKNYARNITLLLAMLLFGSTCDVLSYCLHFICSIHWFWFIPCITICLLPYDVSSRAVASTRKKMHKHDWNNVLINDRMINLLYQVWAAATLENAIFRFKKLSAVLGETRHTLYLLYFCTLH